ncbi:hypothetical protein EON71_01210 [bacterium]|nr:MAG: hypothetical protein EON71_01210 [bacterium]
MYKYRFLVAGADYILNENEVASYSFILVSLMYFLSDISLKKRKYVLIGNTFFCFFIAFIMEARAIEFSILFIPVIYIFLNHQSRMHKALLNILMYLTVIVPILMVIYIGKLIDFYADITEQEFGLPAEDIKSELERFDMFSYVKNKLSQSFWGYGIGNTGYMKDIEIAGLHSGSLDLMYWGGYTLFITFNLIFIVIIKHVLKVNSKLFFCCFILLFYLLLQNYYEGLFFGNMGILLMILSMFTTLIIKAREHEHFNNV